MMQMVQPVALAWDLVGASPGDWVLVRRLRNHPQLSQIPFILYGIGYKSSKATNSQGRQRSNAEAL